MFEKVGVGGDEAPSDLFHVTCTGYTSPSPAQNFVARHGWARKTRVTHVYHMGCYAAFPALRLAAGAQAALPPQPGARRQSEVIHTELCSLHMDASNHTPEQLVIQSLFADGAIRYVVSREGPAALNTPGFELLALQESIIEDSSTAMTWTCSEWGLKMTLARDVPAKIASALVPFIHRLIEQAELQQASLQEAFFAVHPGGPRILDRVQDLLRIDNPRLAHSRKVLRERGNMSSATLPYVWMALANDPQVPPGALVLSLAFGPGLTVCGAVLRKFLP
jgi:predicted naringenin-chalcone synthase